jgi:shikimate dehydrogenase
MHNAALRVLGLDGLYVRLPLPPERFVQTVRALPASGFRGINVTIPHKLAAHELADELTPVAEAVGAANTLSFEEGSIEADNTDAGGFLDALGESPQGRSALVLGAGGAGRAVAWALREAGAAEVSVWNRTAERATALAADLGVRQLERPEPAELIVNATSVGLDEATTEAAALEALGLVGLDPPATLVDLVYGGRESPLSGWGKRHGARVVDGLEVLVCQGALSFHRWTGRDAPLAVMRQAARSP